MERIHLVYYSPAFSTRKTLRVIADNLNVPVKEHDITQGIKEPLSFGRDELVILGIPVYAGRVPAHAVDILDKIKGKDTPAVVVCVYGNRDYDDALLELKDISEKNGFVPIAAGAFIARHSIFPRVAQNRPDKSDDQELIEFGKQCYQRFLNLEDVKGTSLTVKGNFPYKEPSKIPFAPTGDSKCDNCGTCVKKCPVNAISSDNPRKTNKDLCMACARCIAVCPKQARRFKGLLYTAVRKKFESSYSERKKPETFF
ncbi:4Fe-4S binding protein [Dysgonomonas sp. 520]|uniref:4Fe-4S binding protein n=1 Tax=Dysgonomonas sp. 520 TaxID=2302931 RepID=UPI0013D17920|nr:4Fe-4S binding protein [Dysgonomonas sp. 520]NDW08379.1 4Fe-4S ferredoxin [Dysgonomonas sp. 520]